MQNIVIASYHHC